MLKMNFATKFFDSIPMTEYGFAALNRIARSFICSYIKNNDIFIKEPDINVNIKGEEGFKIIDVSEICISEEKLNESIKDYSLPFTFLKFNIKNIEIRIAIEFSISKQVISKDQPIFITIRDLCLSLSPKDLKGGLPAALDELLGSFHESIKEHLENEEPLANCKPIDAKETFAEYINSMLNNIRIIFENPVLNVQYSPQDHVNSKINLQIKLDRATISFENDEKKFVLEGLHVYLCEHTSENASNQANHLREPTLIMKLEGKVEIVFKYKQKDIVNSNLSCDNMLDVRIIARSINVFMSPCQLHVLRQLINAFMDFYQPTSRHNGQTMGMSRSLNTEDLNNAQYDLLNQCDLLNREKPWSQDTSTDSFYSFNNDSTIRTSQHNIFHDSVDKKFFALEISDFTLILLQDEVDDLPILAHNYFQTRECTTNHQYAAVSGFTLECYHKSDRSGISSNYKASANVISVLENLFQPEKITTNLLEFKVGNDAKEQRMGQCCEMSFAQKQTYDSVGTSSLEIILKPFVTEIDISMMDRIYYLYNPKPFCEHFPTTSRDPSALPDSGTKIALSLSSKYVEASISIPIPDLRPRLHRRPSWIRSVRPESLKLQFSDFSLQTELGGYTTVLDIKVKEILGSLVEPNECTFILAVKPPDEVLKGFDWPRMLITLNSQPTHSPLFYRSAIMAASIDPNSLRLDIEGLNKNSLFATRSLMLPTSKNSHTSLQVPNKREEIRNFVSQTIANSLVTVEMTAPRVTLHLLQKSKYELLYNRLFKDLALWESLRINQLVENKNLFYFCRSSQDSSSEEEDDSPSLHYTHFNDQNFNFAPRQPYEDATAKHQFSLLVTINSGTFKTCEEANVVIKVAESQLFVTSGYEGEVGRAMAAVQANNVVVFHNKIAVLRPKRERDNENLTVVTSCKMNPCGLSQTIEVGVGITGMLLHYKDFDYSLKWVPVLMEFFDVASYPVEGDQMKDPNYELDVSINSSAIDYSPGTVDYRAYLQMEALMVHTNFSVHKFFLENFAIRLNDKPGKGIFGEHYVKVLESEFLELSLANQINPEKLDELCQDLKVYNNMIHIWACSDSLKAFIVLVSRFIEEFSPEEEGDLTQSSSSNHLGSESLMNDILSESEPPTSTIEHPSNHLQEVEEENGEVSELEDDDDEFCCIEVELGAGISSRSGQPSFRLLGENGLGISNKSFLIPPEEQLDGMECPAKYPYPLMRYIIKEMSLVLHLFGGSDFSSEPARNPSKSSSSASKSSNRNEEVLMEVNVNKLRVNYSIFPPESNYNSRLVVVMKQFNIEDKLAASKLHKFLCPYVSEKHPLRSHSNQMELRVAFYKPENECDIYLTVSPLRLNIDQTSLYFLVEYLKAVFEDSSSFVTKQTEKKPIYIKTFVLFPEVPCKIDYSGKNEQSDYSLASIPLNYFNFNDTDLMLKSICIRGVLGLEKLAFAILAEWLTDVSQNQYHIILSSIGKLPYIRKALAGVWNLIYQPYHHYMLDGRLMRGLQKGTESFKTDTVGSILELFNEILESIQNAAQFIEGCMIPGPSLPPPGKQVPKDVQEGFKMAAEMIKDSISNLGTRILTITKEEHRHKGLPGAIGGLTRHAPSAFVTEPIKVTSRVVSVVIEGAKNDLIPNAHRDALEKWKHVKHK